MSVTVSVNHPRRRKRKHPARRLKGAEDVMFDGARRILPLNYHRIAGIAGLEPATRRLTLLLLNNVSQTLRVIQARPVLLLLGIQVGFVQALSPSLSLILSKIVIGIYREARCTIPPSRSG